jgi:hypothetical protein
MIMTTFGNELAAAVTGVTNDDRRAARRRRFLRKE